MLKWIEIVTNNSLTIVLRLTKWWVFKWICKSLLSKRVLLMLLWLNLLVRNRILTLFLSAIISKFSHFFLHFTIWILIKTLRLMLCLKSKKENLATAFALILAFTNSEFTKIFHVIFSFVNFKLLKTSQSRKILYWVWTFYFQISNQRSDFLMSLFKVSNAFVWTFIPSLLETIRAKWALTFGTILWIVQYTKTNGTC